jgi:hypothetical protein
MGIQDRDYWQERYYKLIGYEPKKPIRRLFTNRRSLSRRARGYLILFVILSPILAFVLNLVWRFVIPH